MVRNQVSIPERASDAEAAAIVAAVEAHLSAQRVAAASTDEEASPDRSWGAVGRLEATTGQDIARIPDDVPSEAWAAAGRVARY